MNILGMHKTNVALIINKLFDICDYIWFI